jgi:urocanate hydratase
MEAQLKHVCSGLPLDPLPDNRGPTSGIAHAAKRPVSLNSSEKKLAIQNSLRYFPASLHRALAREFADELAQYGHIYMYRFLPKIAMKYFIELFHE